MMVAVGTMEGDFQRMTWTVALKNNLQNGVFTRMRNGGVAYS
jgi:hypothetical protein